MTQKEKAIEFMHILGVDEKLINEYIETDIAILFDNGAGGKLLEKCSPAYAKKIELERRGLIVYAVLHEVMAFGEMYDFLFVSDYTEDWDLSLTSYGDCCIVAATYVWNVSEEHRSEMGSIFVVKDGDSLIRVS